MSLVSGEDIEAEHLAALSRLNPEQKAALRRTREALRRGNFSHHAFKDSLMEVLNDEVRAREAGVSPPSDEEGRRQAVDLLERQHLEALAGLDRDQRAALHRIDRALQINNFSHHSLKETLLELFEQDARRWNEGVPHS